MKNYQKAQFSSENRSELHDLLSLTGCEISFNALPDHFGQSGHS